MMCWPCSAWPVALRAWSMRRISRWPCSASRRTIQAGFVDGGAEGEEGAVAGIEECVLNAPVIEDGDGLVEGVAFADGAEVER